MKVKAIATGFHKGRRRPGDEFEVAPGSKASWYVPVKGTVAAKAAAPTQADQAQGEGQQPDSGLV